MAIVAGTSVVDVCGSLQALSDRRRQKCLATEDAVAMFQTVSATCNPDEFVVEKDVVIHQKIIVKEKVVVSKETLFQSCASATNDSTAMPNNITPPCTATDPTNDFYLDDMDIGSQKSVKMEFGSQESTEQMMLVSSQDSDISKMDALSQETPESNERIGESQKNVCQFYDSVRQFDRCNLKRKFVEDKCKASSSNSNLLKLREESLSLMEKAADAREAAILAQEKLFKCLERGKISNKNPTKRIKLFNKI